MSTEMEMTQTVSEDSAPAVEATGSSTQPAQQKSKSKHGHGASWKADERHVLPHNRMAIVFPGLMLVSVPRSVGSGVYIICTNLISILISIL